MIAWLAFRHELLGRLPDAPTRQRAEDLARRKWGDQVVLVQSEASYQAAEEERRAMRRDRRLGIQPTEEGVCEDL